ncbi:hypothetical protein CA13_57360 [Planctomycetes bacterium CA13]|uniref:SLA1 homology domain-containing protein n=1 Tax=Novipirellula herctigrandis TaxID=2527986 RepID=A0A5C5ZAL7_9BACT|nr:hypothetical protein CA13_57360 [Planctomycetes bacterium CA13]
MTFNRLVRTFSFACAILLGFVPNALARTWTDRTGKFKVDAELVTVRDGKAYLEKTNGQVTAVPLGRLSVKDLTYIASLPEHATHVKALLPETSPSTEGDEAETTGNEQAGNRESHAAGSPAVVMATIVTDSPSASGSIRQFRSDSWGYKGLAFSNDGAYLATLGSDNLTLIDINASTKSAYDIGSDNRSAVAFSADGKRLFAGSFNGEVLVWQFDGKGTLKPENHFSIHRGEIKSIVASPDNKHVITIHSADIACLWDMVSGEVLARYKGFQFSSSGAARFSRYGGHILITDGRMAAVIDVQSRKIIQRMPLSSGSGQFAAISPRGSLISAGRTYDVHYFETQSGKQPAMGEGNEIAWSAAFSPGGKRLITGCREHVKLWNTQSGMPLRKFQMGDSGYVKYVAFSPDGIHFAAIGGPIGKLVEIFRLPSEERRR